MKLLKLQELKLYEEESAALSTISNSCIFTIT